MVIELFSGNTVRGIERTSHVCLGLVIGMLGKKEKTMSKAHTLLSTEKQSLVNVLAERTEKILYKVLDIFH